MGQRPFAIASRHRASKNARMAARRRRTAPYVPLDRRVALRPPKKKPIGNALIWHASRDCDERPRPPCGGGTGWGVAPCRSDWRLCRAGRSQREMRSAPHDPSSISVRATPHPGPPPQGGRERTRRFIRQGRPKAGAELAMTRRARELPKTDNERTIERRRIWRGLRRH
jgi:hypothetical protein